MSKPHYFRYYNFRIYLHLCVGFDQKYFLKQWVQTAISFQIIISCLFLLFVGMTMDIYSLNVLERIPWTASWEGEFHGVWTWDICPLRWIHKPVKSAYCWEGSLSTLLTCELTALVLRLLFCMPHEGTVHGPFPDGAWLLNVPAFRISRTECTDPEQRGMRHINYLIIQCSYVFYLPSSSRLSFSTGMQALQCVRSSLLYLKYCLTPID